MWVYVSVAVITLVYWYFTRTFSYWKNMNVVSPDPWPLFGNTIDLTLQRKFVGTYMRDLYHEYPNEKIVGFYRMTVPVLLVRDLDIIKNILSKDFEFFPDRGIELSKEGLGANLFTASVDTWRVLRAKFSPIFTPGKIKRMLPLIIERADRYLEHFNKNHDGTTEIEVQSVTRNFTMSAIAACVFGLDLDLNDPNLKVLHKIDHLIFDITYLSEFILMHPVLLKLFNNVIFTSELTNFFYDLVRTVFAQRNYKPSKRNDFMDLILELKSQKIIRGNTTSGESEITVELTDGMIAAQAFIFYVGGFETSATTIGYLLYELTQHPDVQDKLLDEIDRTLMQNDDKIDYDTLMNMSYLSKVFDETLRKYPLSDPLQRAACADYEIPGTGVTIKKGQIVIIPVSGIQSDPKYYPNPELFDPERFSPDKVVERHSCAFLPFGIGPKNCIGMRFAKAQTRVFLIKLLSKYRVEASENTPKQLFTKPMRALAGPDKPIVLNVVRR